MPNAIETASFVWIPPINKGIPKIKNKNDIASDLENICISPTSNYHASNKLNSQDFLDVDFETVSGNNPNSSRTK